LSVALGYDAATGVLSGRINRKDTGRCCCTCRMRRCRKRISS
jgi:hypothetical protein